MSRLMTNDLPRAKRRGVPTSISLLASSFLIPLSALPLAEPARLCTEPCDHEPSPTTPAPARDSLAEPPPHPCGAPAPSAQASPPGSETHRLSSVAPPLIPPFANKQLPLWALIKMD